MKSLCKLRDLSGSFRKLHNPLRFVFVESFDNCCWNAHTARHIKGVSGSHTSIMYLAEGLAQQNHTVCIVSIHNNVKEENVNGVQYINFENFCQTECDYIMITMNLVDLEILNKIVEYKKIFLVTHTEVWTWSSPRLFTIDPKKIVIAYVSEFAKYNLLDVQPFLQQYESIVLYNSLDTNDIQPFQVETKENSVSYFACLQRGYKLVAEIIQYIDGFVLYTNTYNDGQLSILKSDNNIIQAGNGSKYSTFQYLAKSKYFVYPIINLDDNMIFCETFGYSVLEALLHGVIVIAPKVGIYEELYGDAICYIETDDLIPQHYLRNWSKENSHIGFRKINSNFGYPIMNRYIDKIRLLEHNPDLRNTFIQRGLKMKEKFSNIVIANRLTEYIFSISKSYVV